MGNFNRDDRNRNRNRHSGGGFGRRDKGRNFNRGGEIKNMYQVVCDACHKDCEVPFKPSNDKPIYCNECFSKQRRERSNDKHGNNKSGFGSQDMSQTSQAHEEIMKAIKDLNYKLDELLKTVNFKESGEKKSPAKKTVAKKITTTKKKPSVKKKK